MVNHTLIPGYAGAIGRRYQGLRLLSNEVEVQRRRKSSGPQGRAEAPARRRESGGGGPLPSGGGPLPGGGGGGLQLPAWLVLLIVIALVVCGGGGSLLSTLLGGEGGNLSPATEAPPAVSTTAPPSAFTPPAGGQAGSWTVMIYQDADDQVLERDIFIDFNEAERVGSSDQVQIVAQLDRFRGSFNGDGNWTSTRRYYITHDNDLNAIHSELIADLGEVNMSDPQTLVDFGVWAIQTFPADHYVLILSDHGMGWPGGWTDPAPGTLNRDPAPLGDKLGNALYLNQLEAALTAIRQQTGLEKFDLIGMDACLMGQLEVLTALEPHARYAITSEETEPALGWAYTGFLEALVNNPGLSPADLARLVVQSYITEDERIVDDQARADFLRQLGTSRLSAEAVAREISKETTLAAVDLAQVPALNNSLNALAYALQGEDQAMVASARNYALAFTSIFGQNVPPSYLDLGNFVKLLQQNSGGEVRRLAGATLSALQQAVIAEKHGSGKKGATGIAIYFPNSSLYRSPYSGPPSYTAIANRFATQSLWDDFLAFHYNNRSFKPAERLAVIPTADLPTRTPGLGQINITNLTLSAKTAAPGQPVTLRATLSGQNIGYVYLLVGYYDSTANAIAILDTDYLESANTREVDGVYYPIWPAQEAFTLKYSWDPTVFAISDGQTTAVALFNPQQYGAAAEDAIYTVEGLYTFAENGTQVHAYLNFREGELVSVYGITGQAATGAPREIRPSIGDTVTLLEKWLDLDSNGQVREVVYQPGQTLTFNGQPWTWVEQYAPAGAYIIGLLVTDLDGTTQQAYAQVTVQ